MKQHHTCTICGSPYLEHIPFETTGAVWSKIFGSLSTAVAAESCIRCGYTEMYKRQVPEKKYAFAFSTN